jgi:ribosomal protein S18 acetylase RimI-like enzyme
MLRPTFTIRLAEPSDIEAVQRISAEAYVPAYQTVIGAVPKPAHEDYRPRIERGEVWVLEIAEGPIGLAVLEILAGYLLVYSIAVRPKYQGRGYGRELLVFADQQAIAAGLTEVRLYTNRRMVQNVRLYRKNGYVEIGARPHPSRPEEVLVDMAKVPTPRPAVCD